MNRFLVGSKHTLSSKTVRIICSIDVPQSTNFFNANILWNPAEAICLELAVSGIRGHHITHLKDRFFILVHFTVSPDFVKTAIVSDFNVG